MPRTVFSLFRFAPFTLVLFSATAVQAGTITFATGNNTTLATADPMNTSPNLVINQILPNHTLGTAQPVSPLWYGTDALGSITSGISGEFFKFNAGAGDFFQLFATTSNPAVQFPELLLYDANQNLVAIASGNASDGSSSIIDFTVPSGDAGTWTAQVTGSPNAPDPAHNFFPFDLRLSGDLVSYSTDVFGNHADPALGDFYSVNANQGDHLHFFVHGANPATQFPELLLYDNNGNLVAIAAGNAADGSSSIIDFTVPFGGTGNWVAEVVGSPNAPNPAANLFPYDLQVLGSTGVGSVNPLPPPTPEPATWSLLLGGSLLGFYLRRRAVTRT